MYSDQESVSLAGIQTAEDLLSLLRKGNSQKLEIGLGDLKVPCRLLSATEEATIIVKASQEAMKKNPSGMKQEVFEAHETMRAILQAATTIDTVPGLPARFLPMLTGTELVSLYDEYVTLNHTINPNVQEMSVDEINEMVDSIKKKTKAAKDFYTWQLAAAGRYFLAVIVNQPTGSGAGSL